MANGFRLGHWTVEPSLNSISSAEQTTRVQPKTMQVLVHLAERPSEVVTKDDLMRAVWADTFVTDDVLTRAISELRRVFGDDSKEPRFIETIPRSGYRLIAPVEKHLRHPRISSMAVLPFAHRGGEPELEYLSDGLTECLIHLLSQFPELRVLARSTVFRYKGREIEARDVGCELKVDAVLSGRVVQQGENLKIVVDLVDVRNGWLLWGKQLPLRWAEILETEEGIAEEIATALRLRLFGGGRKASPRRHTPDVEAYRLFLRARYLWHQGTEALVRQAIGLFEQSIARDSHFALAYAGLAECYSFLGCQIDYGSLPPVEAGPKAEAAARKALELDDTLAPAHSSLASVMKNFHWNWKEAEREFRRASALAPHYPKARQSYADLMVTFGRMDEAMAAIERAHELDPFSATINTDAGSIAYLARDYDRAIQRLRLTLDLQPDYVPAHTLLGLVYEQMGKYAEARAEFETALSLCQDNELPAAVVGRALAARNSLNQGGVEELHKLAERRYVPACWFAAAYIRLGQFDAAFEWLEKAYAEKSNWLNYLRVDPLFDPLRDDPRFQELVRRMNFPA
ncbi:MAG: winged helix-turn-helix domain-containing protein [Terriglobia bacterium]